MKPGDAVEVLLWVDRVPGTLVWLRHGRAGVRLSYADGGGTLVVGEGAVFPAGKMDKRADTRKGARG